MKKDTAQRQRARERDSEYPIFISRHQNKERSQRRPRQNHRHTHKYLLSVLILRTVSTSSRVLVALPLCVLRDFLGKVNFGPLVPNKKREHGHPQNMTKTE